MMVFIRKISLLLLVIYLPMITWLSLTSTEYFPGNFLNFPFADKIVHFCFYLGLSFLFYFSFLGRPVQKVFRLSLTAIILVTSYGVIIELLQYSLTQGFRSFEFGDIIADGIGAVAGTSLAAWSFRMLINFKHPTES